jgi:hypothetical protein
MIIEAGVINELMILHYIDDLETVKTVTIDLSLAFYFSFLRLLIENSLARRFKIACR